MGMYNKVRLERDGGSYILSLTPVQFELIRRVLVHLGGDDYPPIIVKTATGGTSENLLAARDRSVNFQSRSNMDLKLNFEEVGVLVRALGFASLDFSSEEYFHAKYGFYSENIRALGRAIYSALQRLED
ncbi:hypothetical protein [Nocardiopsis sp. CC223A]|uniref:hypothetical protein n=1 Tax=Nocardiopsis sp. CC223A TaxID=3044051 RepID=UPI002796026A|nr:hypothetical protein [Nocardiopsis sp. CC223A]